MDGTAAPATAAGELAAIPDRPLLLDGVPTETGETFEVVFPYDGRVVATVHAADWETCDAALAAATEARRSLADVPPFERAEILLRAAALVRDRAEELARQMTLETGNAIW